MAFATFFLEVLCDVTSFTVGPTQLLRGGRLKQLLAFSFVFPQVVKMHDWPSMKTGTGGCRAAPRTSLNQPCLPAVLLQSHASQFVLRDLAILALKNSRLAEEVVLRRETFLAVLHNMSDGPCRDL